jgi:hypothetical protein
MTRWRCTEHLCEHRQPDTNRGRLVIHDVVDAGGLRELEREHRRRCRVVEVDKGCDPATVAHDRELALPDGARQRVVRGTIQAAVSQGDASCAGHRLVEIAHRSVGLAHRSEGCRIEWIGLGLGWPTDARVPGARKALGHEPTNTRLARSGEQRVRAPGAQLVGRREPSVEVPEVLHLLERGRLVNDRIGLGTQNGLADGPGVEQVELDRLRTERPDPIGTTGRVVGPDDLVSALDELREQPAADRTAGTCDKDSHRVLLRFSMEEAALSGKNPRDART